MHAGEDNSRDGAMVKEEVGTTAIWSNEAEAAVSLESSNRPLWHAIRPFCAFTPWQYTASVAAVRCAPCLRPVGIVRPQPPRVRFGSGSDPTRAHAAGTTAGIRPASLAAGPIVLRRRARATRRRPRPSDVTGCRPSPSTRRRRGRSGCLSARCSPGVRSLFVSCPRRPLSSGRRRRSLHWRRECSPDLALPVSHCRANPSGNLPKPSGLWLPGSPVSVGVGNGPSVNGHSAVAWPPATVTAPHEPVPTSPLPW
jgi:hypothetical protein